MKQNYFKGFAEEKIAELDPTLKVVRHYTATGLFGVSVVAREGKPFVIKWAEGDEFKENIRTEIRALEKLASVAFPLTPNLEDVYETAQGFALLKTYNPGITLKDFVHSAAAGTLDHILSPRLYHSAQRLVKAIHDRGVVALDLDTSSNVILYGNGSRFCLFDFDCSELAMDLSEEEVEKKKKIDFELLDELFS